MVRDVPMTYSAYPIDEIGIPRITPTPAHGDVLTGHEFDPNNPFEDTPTMVCIGFIVGPDGRRWQHGISMGLDDAEEFRRQLDHAIRQVREGRYIPDDSDNRGVR